MELILGVIGSRRRNSFSDFHKLKLFILKAREKFPQLSLVSGGCPSGADAFIEDIASELKIPLQVFLPDRSKLPSKPVLSDFTLMFYARNKLIAEACEVLVAMVAPDRTGGSENTIRYATEMKKKCILL